MVTLRNACKIYKTQLNAAKNGEKSMKLLLELLQKTINKTNGISTLIQFLHK